MVDFHDRHKQKTFSRNSGGFIRQCCVMQNRDHCKFGLPSLFLTNCNEKSAAFGSERLTYFALTLVMVFMEWRRDFCSFPALKVDGFLRLFLGQRIKMLEVGTIPLLQSCKH